LRPPAGNHESPPPQAVTNLGHALINLIRQQ
jgi:hypothetical protein